MGSFIRARDKDGNVVEIPIAKVGKSAYEIALKHGFDGTEEEWVESLKGLPGKTGNGIARIEKTYVSGLVDTYTITFTDNTTATFTVTNGEDGDDGVGIKSIVQTTTSSADGGENVITVTLTNGSTSTFKVKNGSKGNKGDTGNSIKSVTKTSTSGLTDTYTITFTDNTTATFTVTNGKAGTNGTNGTTPVAGVDYPTDAQIDEKIATALANRNQLEPIIAESKEWLDANGDPTKIYIVPNADGQGGKVYAYAEKTIVTEPEQPETPADVNVLEGMTLRVGRYGSSGSWSAADLYATHRTTELIPCDDDDRITIENWLGGSGSMYISFFDASRAWIGKLDLVRNETTNQFSTAATTANPWADKTNYTYSATTATSKPLSEALGKTGIAYFTVCSSDATVDSNNRAINGYAIYVNKGSGSSTITHSEPTIEIVPDWYAFTDFVPTDDARIDELNRAVSVLDTANTALKRRVDAIEENGVTSGGATSISKAQALLKIRNWDKPIYERLTPFLLDEDLTVDTTYPKTYTDSADSDGSKRRVNVQKVYDEYNALCTAHPDFVRDITDVEHGLLGATETTFGGLCSDGIQYVRVYEFCEREGRHSNTTVADNWSETKPTFIIVTGIHWEYNGVYSMLYALKEITENPKLRDMRRNCRFIVIPMSNPYSFTAYKASGGGHYNANGVEIHNNFAVDFNNAIDSTHGTAPLTEVETRYIDNALRKYRDTAVCLLSGHSNASKGANFIWGSVATKFMCNVSMRLVDLMSNAWDVKYDGTDGNYNYRELIDANKSNGSNPQDDGDYRCGYASLSTSSGTEAKQATLYGVQGFNVEVYEYFYPFDPTGTDKLLAYSRGAETYINLLRLLAVTYDHNDRDKYAPKPAYEIQE